MTNIKNQEEIYELLLKWHINCLFDTDISSHVEIFQYERHENICIAGEDMSYFLFIVKGKVKVYSLLSNGKLLSWCYYSALSVLGEVELCESIPIMSTVISLEPTWCMAIPMKLCKAKTSNSTKFWKYLTHSLGMKLSLIANNSAYNQSYPLEARLASYILGIATDNKFECNLIELAQALGVSYRHLHRILRKFKDDGILVKNDVAYTILKPIVLQKLVVDSEVVLDFSCPILSYLYNAK